MASRSSVIKRPKPALSLFYAARRDALRTERPDLTKLELRTLMNEEWRLLSQEQKDVYLISARTDRETNRELLEEAKTLGVDEFMKEVKESRLKADPEFAADQVLAILDNKRCWKKTWGRKQKPGDKRLKLN